MATNGNLSHSEQFPPTSTASVTASAGTTADENKADSNNLSKDEVAWFFVEQYYTTLSKTPEKLHLFYGKRSQFVYGLEAEVANVSVGRQTIQERIKQLDFQDCKVRVSNVDSQASFDNIVIQVIGEVSNKAGDPKKFVQTFVLAQQPSGYFVLNDILRYIDEESDDEPAEAVVKEEQVGPVEMAAPTSVVQAKESPQSTTAASVQEAPSPPLDPGVVDRKLEEVGASTKDTASTNGDSVTDASPEKTNAVLAATSKPEEAPVPDPETTAQEIADEDTKTPEKPTDPSPTPVTTARQPPAPTAAAVPAQPPKPMTWANRVAISGARPAPAVPMPKAPTPQTAPQARPAVPAQPAAPQAASTTTHNPEPTETPAPAKEASAEWQTADSRRHTRPQSISGPPAEKDSTLGYVKYVTDKVSTDQLRAALQKHGDLIYFDINRQKNCAFVEYANVAAYQAAVAANPHTVDGETIVVEPRRPKAGAYGGSNYTTGRGNMSNRGGRGGFDGGRSGSQGGRGGFPGQNRGRGGPARGRGPSQTANA
ncbi:hypothetical protein F4778DRAFT_766170 [Xylariomycetidae sp. FL2044]|nr:hypothetical protein F4778DRAFT_775130 [Xylariomycetidae sp. FL2044]KAH9883596.1 hypothetical protein F4778DRAFT_766170 [Xylariomycetidae sp. FL2044]